MIAIACMIGPRNNIIDLLQKFIIDTTARTFDVGKMWVAISLLYDSWEKIMSLMIH